MGQTARQSPKHNVLEVLSEWIKQSYTAMTSFFIRDENIVTGIYDTVTLERILKPWYQS